VGLLAMQYGDYVTTTYSGTAPIAAGSIAERDSESMSR
jgi:hypothetical protein